MAAKASFRVISDKDNGFDDFFKTLREMDKQRVKVGVQGAEAQVMRGDVTNVQLAVIHEFGSPKANIPQRSFLRSTADKEQDKIRQFFNRRATQLLKRRDPNGVPGMLRKAGEFLRKSIVTRMSVNEFGRVHPLKPATIARKGDDPVALVDTGDLRGSISVELTDD